MATVLISGDAGTDLADELEEFSNWKRIHIETRTFHDGESYLYFPEFPNEQDRVVVVQSLYAPQHFHLFQLLNIIDTLVEHGVSDIVVVTPYLCYARADRDIRGGDAISARTVLHLLERVGTRVLLAIDIHNPQIRDFASNLQIINIIPSKSIAEFVQKQFTIDSTWQVVAPDYGAFIRAKQLAKELNISYAALKKKRDPVTGEVHTEKMNGNFQKHIIMVDDIMASGRSLVNAMNILLFNDVETISVFISHAMGTGSVDQMLTLGNGIVASTTSVPSIISTITVAKEIYSTIMELEK